MQALPDRLPNRMEAPSWPPVRAPIPPKTACRSAAWHGRVPAGIGVGDGVGSSIVVGGALIQGTGAGRSFLGPAVSCEPAAPPPRATPRTAIRTERAAACPYDP